MKIDNSFITASKLGTPLRPLTNKVEEPNKDFTGGFKQILDDLWDASKEASAVSRAETAKLIIGEQDDLPGMQVKGEQSSILFELNLAVRAKVIDAYNEILRTQV